MLNIKKYEHPHGYNCYEIETNEGKFEINYQGNLDLYWRYPCNKENIKKETIKDFYITKEDYFIYTLFNDLYISIKENKPYYNYPYDNEDKNEIIEDIICPLFKNNKIIFISDDGFIENGSRFIIEKIDEDTYKLTFKKGIYSEVTIQTFSIRISNSGSRYEPFNTVFMSMYKKLKEYDFNNHQIHIEEYMYIKKKIKQRSR